MQDEANNEPFYCIMCIKNEMPFGFESDDSIKLTTKGLNPEYNLDGINFSLNQTEKKTIQLISDLIIEQSNPDNTNTVKTFVNSTVLTTSVRKSLTL